MKPTLFLYQYLLPFPNTQLLNTKFNDCVFFNYTRVASGYHGILKHRSESALVNDISSIIGCQSIDRLQPTVKILLLWLQARSNLLTYFLPRFSSFFDGAAVPRPSVTIASPAALQRRYKSEEKIKIIKKFSDNNRKAHHRGLFCDIEYDQRLFVLLLDLLSSSSSSLIGSCTSSSSSN